MDFERVHKYFLMAGAIIISVSVIGWWFLGTRTAHEAGEAEITSGDAVSLASSVYGEGGPETHWSADEEAEFQMLVVLRDQAGAEGLKRGEILAIRRSPHAWSETERTSYLIVRVRLTGAEAERILATRAQHVDFARVGWAGDQVITGQPLEDKVFEKDILLKK